MSGVVHPPVRSTTAAQNITFSTKTPRASYSDYKSELFRACWTLIARVDGRFLLLQVPRRGDAADPGRSAGRAVSGAVMALAGMCDMGPGSGTYRFGGVGGCGPSWRWPGVRGGVRSS